MFSRKEKALLLILGAVNFTHIVDFMIIMPLGPQLIRIFGIDAHQFGLLVSSYAFAAGASGLLFSIFVDRFDRKKALLFLYVGFALSTIACAISRSFDWLLVSRALAGTFGGVLTSVVMSIVSDTISSERRGSALGIVMGSFSLASILGVPFSLYLANLYDWHSPFMFLGIVATFICLIISMLIPPVRDHLRGPLHERNIFDGLRNAFGNSSHALALLFIFLVVFGQFTVIPFLSPSFVANAGLLEGDLPLIYLFGGFISMFSSPFFGRMSDKFGARKVFIFGASLSILPILLITNLGPMPTWLLLVVSCSFFFVMSGRMVPAMTMMSKATTPRHRGSFMSITSSVQQMAISSGSYFAGWMVVNESNGHMSGYQTVGFVAVLFTMLALFCVTKIKQEEKERTKTMV